MPGLTQPQIANVALGYLNAAPITSLDEASPHAVALSTHWDLCRQSMLREYDWGFARKNATLTQLSGASLTAVASPDYTYAYALPADFLCARNAQDAATLARIDYDIRPTAVLADATTLALTYTADITNAGTWDPTFADAFAMALAGRAAKLVTGSDEKGAELLTLLKRDFLAPAKIASATESRPERDGHSFLPQSNLIDARDGTV